MPVQWNKITQKQFESLPEPQPPRQIDPEWEELMAALQQGQVVEIPYADETDRRGKRLALGRRAAGKGFKVDIRYDEAHQSIAARKSEEPLPPREKKPPTNRGHRRSSEPAQVGRSMEGEEG